MAENYYDRSNDPIVFDVVEELGVLSMHNNGWNREVNIVAWNGRPAKIDIRDWDPEHKRMSKGITLKENEALRMAEILIGRLGPYGRRRSISPQQEQSTAEAEHSNDESCSFETPDISTSGTDSMWDDPRDNSTGVFEEQRRDSAAEDVYEEEAEEFREERADTSDEQQNEEGENISDIAA